MNEKKGYIAITYFIIRASFLGLSSMCLIEKLKQDAWLTLIIGTILGIIPLILIYKIADKMNEDNIISYLPKIFPKHGKYLNVMLGTIIYLYTCLTFWNLINLIASQYLNKTPKIIIYISFIIPIIMLQKKEDKIISRVSFILFLISLLLYIITFFGLIHKFKYTNLFPILENNPLNGMSYYMGYNILPLITIYIVPGKYIRKFIIKGYILGTISLIISMLFLISVLGINLVILFQYPEFHILKLVFDKLISIRLENLLALQWIIDIFILITLGLRFSKKAFTVKNEYILPLIMIIICTFILSNNILITYLIKNMLAKIIIIIIGLIIFILAIKKRKIITKI